MFTAEERREYIGGSDIAAVMGMNRWKTSLTLWLEKIGEIDLKQRNWVENWKILLQKSFLKRQA